MRVPWPRRSAAAVVERGAGRRAPGRSGNRGRRAASALGAGALGASMALAAGVVPGSAQGLTGRPPLAALGTAAGAISQSGGKLTGSGESGAGDFGQSVAVSADGSTALVAALYDQPQAGASLPAGVGAVWAYTRSGSGWTATGKLSPSGETGEGDFGSGLSLSADGSTALVGGEGQGAAWVFTRSGDAWTQQAELTPNDEDASTAQFGQFGSSVVLSADGGTAIVAAENDQCGLGALWTFTRSGTTWSQVGTKLLSSIAGAGGCAGTILLGAGLALSSDGDTLLAGAPGDDVGPQDGGGAAVFVRTSSGWVEQGGALLPSDAGNRAAAGSAVALSADGNTALIGGGAPQGGTGTTWVFTRSGSTWTQQAEAPHPSDEAGDGGFGSAVALSSDGGTAFVGGDQDGGGKGALWVFTRSGEAWTQQGTKLTPSDESGAGGFGAALSVSSSGTVAWVGAPTDSPGTPIGPSQISVGAGAAWVFGPAVTPTPTASPNTAPASTPASPAAPASSSAGGGFPWWLLAVLLLVVIALVMLLLWARRRRQEQTSPGGQP